MPIVTTVSVEVGVIQRVRTNGDGTSTTESFVPPVPPAELPKAVVLEAAERARGRRLAVKVWVDASQFRAGQ
jgi:hypothetical protein